MTHGTPLSPARARCWLATLACLLLALFSSPLLAQQSGFSNLRVVPNPAAAYTRVVARIFGQECEFGAPVSVEVQGNQVRLVRGDLGFCFSAPPPRADFDVPLGAFSPGTYTLTVPVGQGAALSTTFVVLADATTVPVANHPATLATLAVGMLLLTAFALRRR